MQENEANPTENPMVTNSNAKMDAIRDILFGQTVKEYTTLFEQLQGFVQENHSQTLQQIEILQSQLSEMLAGIEKTTFEKIQVLEENTKKELQRQDKTHVNRKQLGNLLTQLGKEINMV
ncbi:MAG: hypothetical protein H7Y04_09525 [Verrucomicrobia bacterium]|nr:hypothetical protein [Cytophagales bacterium]